MIRLEPSADADYRCRTQECPIHWNPRDTLFYLKISGDWPLRED